MPLRTRTAPLFAGIVAVAALALTGCAGGASGAASIGSAENKAAADQVVSVESFAPTNGALSGGTTVTVEGSGFADDENAVASVSFGDTPAASYEVEGDGSLTAVTDASYNFAAQAVPVTVTLADGSTVSTTQGFSYEVQTPVDAQMAYAFAHWQDYNLAEWGEFPDNDCGNFVNQAMLQRGWEQNADWYSDYATTGDYSYSWIRGNQMDAYYASRPDTTRYDFDDRSQLKIGDVVMFDWDPQNDNGVDHTMIISKVSVGTDGGIDIAMVGHTLDATYRDLDNAVTVEKPGGTAHFWSIA
ncbi:MAG: amidase domain-containing protein [Herbiconiux sp.]|nr:amidase domain-containing protein [Herbiconiux sp.]